MKTTTVSQYGQQAADFLTRYAVAVDIKPAKDKAPAWVGQGDKHGHRYRVTLRHNDRPSVSFDFWGSINDREKGERPSAYDVLACISGDVNCPETFTDFCGEYGYDEDSRKAEATFKRCHSLAMQLRAFFPEGEERDALCEIA